MSHYIHLTIKERESILKLLAEGNGIREIARRLCRSASTISRELARNKEEQEYWPSKADAAYRLRRLRSRRKRILDDPEKKAYVQKKIIEEQWSPEQIDYRTREENSPNHVSYATIYRAIYAGRLEERKLHKGERGIVLKLRHKGKKRRSPDFEETRGKIKISHPIEERPPEAEARSEIGHLEADTVLGKAGKACLLVLVDRKTRFTWMKKLPGKKAEYVRDGMIQMLSQLPEGYLRSITPDRGKEFSLHEEISARLEGVQFYFPPPHAPWARGTSENTNGLLRQNFHKGSSFDEISDDFIQAAADKLNFRPRKCLGWKSPFELFFNQVLHLT